MLLDAPTFKTVLTPEAALGIIQKTLSAHGIGKYDVTDFKLVYTPYYYFSFDVIAESGQSPSGKTALNAYTGDLNDFVPYLMDRPLKKVRESEDKAEVEPTAISSAEAKDAAAAKLASHVGLKKDTVHISAVSKLYVPTYRIWIELAGGDERKVEIDALVGAPVGLDDLPEKPKTFNDSVKTVLEKMKSPAGWSDLIKGLGGLFAPGGSPWTRYAVLGLVIVVLLFLVGRNQGILGGQSSISCTLNDAYLGPPSFLGLFGDKPVQPGFGANQSYQVKGTCSFENHGAKAIPLVVARVLIKRGDAILALDSPTAKDLVPSDLAIQKPFTLTWKENALKPVQFVWERGV